MKPGTAVILLLATSGCIHHRIEFGDIQHSISMPKQNAAVIVVIDQATLDQTVDVHSWLTGIAHSWDARPGQMLKQVADIELPQMFSSYEVTTAYHLPTGESGRLVLQLAVPNYRFENFHATVTVHAIARASADPPIFDKTYMKEGDTQGGRMFWGGAFAMKSAIRQSSYDAYKKVFADLRDDLRAALDSRVFGGAHPSPTAGSVNPRAAPAPGASSTQDSDRKSVEEKLRNLAELRDHGDISAKEYSERRRRILDEAL